MAKWFEDAGIWYNLDQYVAIWITPGKDLVGELPNGHTNIIVNNVTKASLNKFMMDDNAEQGKM